VARRDFDDRGALMQLADALRDKLGSGVAALGGEVEGKVNFLCVVTDDLIARGVRAGDLVKEIAAVAGGSGGGKPHLAQAGGKDASKIDAALALAEPALRKRLN
jgi:alanyl-tRNA synthetase